MSVVIKNTAIYTIGGIIPKIAQFFLLPLYTSYLTTSDYGIVTSMQVLYTIFAIFFTLAVDRSIFRLFFDYKTKIQKKVFFGTISISILIISSLFLIFLILAEKLISQIFTSISFYPYYFLTILSAFFLTYTLVPKTYFQVTERSVEFVFASILEFISVNLFTVYYVVYLGEGALGYLKGGLIGIIVIMPYFIYITYKISLPKFNLKIFKEVLSFSIPIIPVLMAAWVIELSDRIFIEKYFNLEDVGIYSLAYKIGSLIIIFTQAFNRAYNPYFYKIANSNTYEKGSQILKNYNNVYIIIVLFSGFILSIFSKDFIILFFESRYHSAYKLIPIITMSYVIGQSAGLLNLSIYQMKKSVVVMYITLVTAVVNTVFNFILVPIFGAYGAAYSTLITFTFILLLQYNISKRYYFVPIDFKSLFIIIFFMISILSFFYIYEFGILIDLLLKLFTVGCTSFIVYKKFVKQIKVIINND